ncbi:ketopantoate reductase family protein [Desertibaculum subflavum]|uniref:ketopantoate reductase family protein n=1 Tax=Desertibaculum subflavum TaxID=2268458 RepID=UPI000E6659BE
MKIAIIGAGGVGGYFGARLAAAGNEVHFVARGAHLKAMREHGLKVKSPCGDIALEPVNATDDASSIGPADIVLFCVKLYDTESAAAKLGPLVGKDTLVIPLQNGVDSAERMAAVVPPANVVGGVAYISATIAAPGQVAHLNKVHKLDFGRLDGQPDARLARFEAAGNAAGFVALHRTDITVALWEKFLFLASFAAVTAAARVDNAGIQKVPELSALLHDAMAEVAAIAKAKGIQLAADAVARNYKFVASMPGPMKASMAHDLDRGNRLEVDGLSGTIVRMGAALNVPTPVHRALHAILLPHKDGKPS